MTKKKEGKGTDAKTPMVQRLPWPGFEFGIESNRLRALLRSTAKFGSELMFKPGPDGIRIEQVTSDHVAMLRANVWRSYVVTDEDEELPETVFAFNSEELMAQLQRARQGRAVRIAHTAGSKTIAVRTSDTNGEIFSVNPDAIIVPKLPKLSPPESGWADSAELLNVLNAAARESHKVTLRFAGDKLEVEYPIRTWSAPGGNDEERTEPKVKVQLPVTKIEPSHAHVTSVFDTEILRNCVAAVASSGLILIALGDDYPATVSADTDYGDAMVLVAPRIEDVDPEPVPAPKRKAEKTPPIPMDD